MRKFCILLRFSFLVVGIVCCWICTGSFTSEAGGGWEGVIS